MSFAIHKLTQPVLSLSVSSSTGRIANQTAEENENGNGGATKRNQLTSGNSCTIGGGAGTGVIGAITSGGVAANGTGGGGPVTMTSSGIVSGGVGMTPGGGPMMVGGSGGGVMDEQMAATGTNSSRPYDTPERRSSIRIRGQSVVNDGRNVK